VPTACSTARCTASGSLLPAGTVQTAVPAPCRSPSAVSARPGPTSTSTGLGIASSRASAGPKRTGSRSCRTQCSADQPRRGTGSPVLDSWSVAAILGILRAPDRTADPDRR